VGGVAFLLSGKSPSDRRQFIDITPPAAGRGNIQIGPESEVRLGEFDKDFLQGVTLSCIEDLLFAGL
jgi:hypothetical protein